MQDGHGSEWSHKEPLSGEGSKATHMDMACKDNVHAMLKEKVLQHHSQAEPFRRRTTLSGAIQRQNNALSAFHSCPTSCRQNSMRIERLLAVVALQVTALQQRELKRAKHPLLITAGRGGEVLVLRGIRTHMARACACHAQDGYKQLLRMRWSPQGWEQCISSTFPLYKGVLHTPRQAALSDVHLHGLHHVFHLPIV